MPVHREFSLAGGDHAGGLAETTTALQQQLALHIETSRERSVTFLDTFDWRVHGAGFVLTQTAEGLELNDRDTGALVIRAPAPDRVCFAAQLPAALRQRLDRALGVRALRPVAMVRAREQVLSQHDSEAKTVARLVVADHEVGGEAGRATLLRRASVITLRGYAKPAAALATRLADLAGVAPAGASVFAEALAVTGRRAGDYSSKLSVAFRRDASTYDAARLVYRSLLDNMRANEAGTIADVDSEFLHDFRVALRRTRSALKELPGALPAEVEQHFRGEFRWLGQITTPTRDLDVYLLDFPSFVAAVGPAAADLDPLHRFVLAEQRRAHAGLRRALRSARYRRLREEWSAVIDAESPSAPPGPAGLAPVGATADRRIRQVAKRLLRDGSAISPDSPAEALHDLRKRAKELRYLLEFFASLYDGKTHAGVVSALKGLQDNLGTFQDAQVQRHEVESFAERMHSAGGTPAATLLAAGRLVATFDERQASARAEFAGRFASFAGPGNRRRLARLTGGDG